MAPGRACVAVGLGLGADIGLPLIIDCVISD